jgi:hypothetical protein
VFDTHIQPPLIVHPQSVTAHCTASTSWHTRACPKRQTDQQCCGQVCKPKPEAFSWKVAFRGHAAAAQATCQAMLPRLLLLYWGRALPTSSQHIASEHGKAHAASSQFVAQSLRSGVLASETPHQASRAQCTQRPKDAASRLQQLQPACPAAKGCRVTHRSPQNLPCAHHPSPQKPAGVKFGMG